MAALATMLLSPAWAGPVAASAPLGDPSVISQWSLLAEQTFLGDATKRPQEAFLYLAFVDIAMYDAVVGIDGRYESYSDHASPAAGASDQAAAVTAAHHVVETYSPYAQAAIDAAYGSALSAIPDGPDKTAGIAYGTLVANDLIGLRASDGRNAPISFTLPPGPGVWRPTPPLFQAMFVPWMGFVTPLVLKSGEQFDPGPPPPLTSKRYATALNEVQRLGGGGATPNERTADQTATALFFSGNATVQYFGALADLAARHQMDIVDSARLFAAVDTSMADALIVVWHAKLTYGFWRPSTAINLADTDGNPATDADPSWTPLLVNPPYPDWVSGYSGVTGAFTRSVEDLLGTGGIDANLRSTAVPGAVRHYETAGELTSDVIDARVWLGIHFRFADVSGVKVGQHAANWVLGHAFQPIGN